MLTLEGNIVTKEKVFRGRIEINDSGMINKIGVPGGAADFIFKDELIFPGFVDLHVHARESVDHTQDYKEDFKTAGEAAVNGGVVAFIEMPNNPTPPIDDASYEAKKELTKKSLAEVVLYAGIGPSTHPLTKNVPYKAYMGPSVGDLFFKSLEDIDRVLSEYKGASVSFHCEDPKILDEHAGEAKHELRRPKEAEVSALDFAISMIEKYGLQGKVCHTSTKEAVEKIRAAKARGVNIVAEVSPHHLFFDTTKLSDVNRNWMQMNPPLRSEEDRTALLEGLREGVIDFVATDHAPHSQEEKEKGTSGTPQLDTYGNIVAWLLKEKNFTPEIIARIISGAGNFINKWSEGKYGEIKEGNTGSLAVLDMNKSVTIERSMLKTKCGWSTYEGMEMPGSVVMTVVKGKVLKNETK